MWRRGRIAKGAKFAGGGSVLIYIIDPFLWGMEAVVLLAVVVVAVVILVFVIVLVLIVIF